jgi:hypothetical protein
LRHAHPSCTALASNALAAASAVSNLPIVSFNLVASFLMVAWKRPDRCCTPRYLRVAIALIGRTRQRL